MIKWIVGLWLLFISVDAFAATLNAIYIYRIRNRFTFFAALAFAGVAIDAAIVLLLIGLSPAGPPRPAWFVLTLVVARGFKTVTMVALLLFLTRFIDGNWRKVFAPDDH